MHNYHLDRGPPRAAFKVDIQKAYDTADWVFLYDILVGFGFYARMINWIMECVSTTSYSLTINGNLHGFFYGRRGLRQGDPLSPYLFTLVMEILTLIIHQNVRNSDSFYFHPHCEEINIVNLCFADDLFIFIRGDVESAKVVMDSLDEFKMVSGLTPSIAKSTAFFCNVLNHVKLAILDVLTFEEGLLPVKYYERVLWSQGTLKKGKVKVTRDSVCLPKEERGLGVQKLEQFNVALIAGHIWRLLTLNTLIDKVSPRLIANAGFQLNARVLDVVVNNSWTWPISWADRFDPGTPPILYPERQLLNGKIVRQCIPKHSFILWLAVLRKLKTQDVLRSWDVRDYTNQDVLLCPLFVWDDIVSEILPFAHKNSIKSVVTKLLFTAAVYYIWRERNSRLFAQKKRAPDQHADAIIHTWYRCLVNVSLSLVHGQADVPV
uniref:uncharacterized protein LOC122601298 n=1 Tax=Erigeron canadensis TaxID=72917 RepID=UPI001CB88BC7|nr:uncharacterized protein LOC122601298 [Erigeron canadensis]